MQGRAASIVPGPQIETQLNKIVNTNRLVTLSSRMHHIDSIVINAEFVRPIVYQELAKICVALEATEMQSSEAVHRRAIIDKRGHLHSLKSLRTMFHYLTSYRLIIVEACLVQDRVPSLICHVGD